MDLQWSVSLSLPRDLSNAEIGGRIENNKHSPPGTVDLHGLYVQEAIEYTEKAIQRGQSQNMSTLHVIVGKGIHSRGPPPSPPLCKVLTRHAGHVAKIKPAIEKLMVQ